MKINALSLGARRLSAIAYSVLGAREDCAHHILSGLSASRGCPNGTDT